MNGGSGSLARIPPLDAAAIEVDDSSAHAAPRLAGIVPSSHPERCDRSHADTVSGESMARHSTSCSEQPCPKCGYLRRDFDHRSACPECGERLFDGEFVVSGRGTDSAASNGARSTCWATAGRSSSYAISSQTSRGSATSSHRPRASQPTSSRRACRACNRADWSPPNRAPNGQGRCGTV
jgi:hypothetical protein